jgi:hypothetical protein
MPAPEVSTFGDGSHESGETGITIDGAGFGAFPGSVWIYENVDRTGDADQLTVASWNDIQLSVDIPASLNNGAGTCYLFVQREDLAWSNALAFTLASFSSVTLAETLAAATVRPVYIAFFDIKDTPVRGWTGPGILVPTGTGDDDFDDFTYDHAEGAVSITDIIENQGIGGEVSITFAVSESISGWIWGESQWGIDYWGNPGGPVYDQIIVDRRSFLGRKAVIWRGFLVEDDSGILPEIERIFTGVMIGCSMQRQTGRPTLATLVCDQDTQFANMAPARLMDHQFFNPSDTSTSFLNDLVRGPIAGGSVVNGGGGGGGGASPTTPKHGVPAGTPIPRELPSTEPKHGVPSGAPAPPPPPPPSGPRRGVLA